MAALSAASNIGMNPPEGITAEQNIAAVIAALAVSVKSNSESSHTHSNKAVIDAITADVKKKYDNLVLLFSAIKTISNVVKDDSTLLPTGKAIVDYVKELGGGDMLKATYDSDDDGVVDDASKLGGQAPAYYQKSTDNTLQTDNKTVTGAINEVYGMAQNGGKNLIGEDFSSEKSYTVGKHVINGNSRYRFIVDHPAGPWDASHVEEILVDKEVEDLNEKITIPLTPVSQVTGYFAQLYKQGNHIFGNGRIAGMTSLPKVESVRSFDNWTGNLVAAATTGLRRIFSTSGNPFKLKNNIYHIIGCGTRSTYNGATGAIVTNSSVVAAMFDGEYTHILLQYDAIPSASGSTQSGVFFIDILI